MDSPLAIRPPAEARDRAHLDKALSRAQRRMADAVRELARVRKLAVPVILAAITDRRMNAARDEGIIACR